QSLYLQRQTRHVTLLFFPCSLPPLASFAFVRVREVFFLLTSLTPSSRSGGPTDAGAIRRRPE
ncbi:hypothetical protein, partial [Pandoraea apista]|uniref:hypothetical protein n=1 Tax=Pandoraea apista TaxID=93218 RepID=UPI001FD3EACC